MVRSHTQLRRPRVSPILILGADMAPSSGHAEVASHMPQLEGPGTRIYNYVPRGFGEKKKKNRLARDVVKAGASL